MHVCVAVSSPYLGVSSNPSLARQCYGWVIQAMAREYRFEDAFELLRDMKEQNLTASERHLFLLRHRCKVRVDDVILCVCVCVCVCVCAATRHHRWLSNITDGRYLGPVHP